MSLKQQSRLVNLTIIIASILVVLTVGAVGASANPPVLILSESDTTVKAGAEDAWISVYMANYQDTVSAFTFRVILETPDLVEFRGDVVDSIFDTIFQYCDSWDQYGECNLWIDTMYVDTHMVSGAIDTTGSIISGWEFVTAWTPPSMHGIKVTAFADQLGLPYTPGLLPRTQPGLLFRLKVRAYAETSDSSRNQAYFGIIPSLGETAFSDPHGYTIGTITYQNFVDSSYFLCESWNGLDCNRWVDTTEAFADSIALDTAFRYWYCQSWNGPDCDIWGNTTFPGDTAGLADSVSIDTTAKTILDTTVTFYISGSMTIDYSSCVCGDINGDERVNVGDAVYTINHVFKGGPPPVNMDCADINGDNRFNVGEGVYLINYVFKGGAAPYCD